MRQPDLFSWAQPCKLIVFPVVKRVGRIRQTAEKMLAKPTDRAAAFYHDQVTDALVRSLEKVGVPKSECDEQVGAFWQAVRAEMARLTYRGQRPGGGAA